MAAKKKSASARKKPKQVRSAAMVEGILEAAARVFVRQGFAKATTNRIAQAAGISVGSLYQYFPSKDAIAVELLRRYRERVVSTIARRVQDATPETFADFVRALLKDMLNDASIDPTLQRVLIEQVLRTSARREMLGFEEQLEATIANTLRAAGLAREPEVAAFVLVRSVLSVVQAAVADRPKLNTPVLVDELTRLVVGYVGVVA